MRLFSLTQTLKEYLRSGHQRTVIAKKNILASFAIKGISVLTSFLLVPITIKYLNAENYGIWLTLFSIISWFGLLDIGLGNGLRNKLTEAIALKKYKLAKIYVSTTYAVLSIIMLTACVLFLLANQYFNWSSFLNVNPSIANELRHVVAIIFVFFSSQLVVKLISTVLLANQKTAFASSLNTIASVISLIVVYVLSIKTQGSLLYLALAIGAINVIVPILVSIYLYKRQYKNIAPSIKFIKFKFSKQLMNIGFMFFLFQSTALIVVATDNILISKLINVTSVTPYNIAFKYLSPLTVFFSLISAPLWSAYTEAYTMKDYDWIKRTTKKMIQIWFILLLLAIPAVALSPFVYKLWIGNKSELPSIYLTIWMSVYILFSAWNQIFGNFINGVGKLRIGFIIAIITSLINIPLCILFTKYLNFGLCGIIIASSVSLLPDLILLPMQYYKIVNQKAKGIWNK